jgi:hypothetical protein
VSRRRRRTGIPTQPPRKVWRETVAADLSVSANARKFAIAADDADGWPDWAALDEDGLGEADIVTAINELDTARYITMRDDGYVFRCYHRMPRRPKIIDFKESVRSASATVSA